MVLDLLKTEIAGAGGNEVCFVGMLGEGGLVDRIEVRARGNSRAVPAPTGRDDHYDVLIHNHPSGRLEPSEDDLAIAARLADSGVGFYIVDNSADRVYAVVEPISAPTVEYLDPDRLAAALESGGAIARRLGRFEPRESQLDLLRLAARAFNEDLIIAAEAGTGVGKSFAYLVPAMAWAAANRERVIVSTATINLQQQLYEKDIPLVLQAMRRKVKAVLIKGRSNYLCLRRLNDALAEPDLFADDAEALSRLAAWSETTPNGSKSDLPFLPDEAVWSRVCSEADLCLGMRCPHRDACFFLKLKREAADAGVIVVNHHLLFADLAARRSGAGYEATVVLPPYARVILDESHTVEEAATAYFSDELGRFGILRQAARLYRRRGARTGGLIWRLATLADEVGAPAAVAEAVDAVKDSLDKVDAAGLKLTESDNAVRLIPDAKEARSRDLLPALEALRLTLMAVIQTVRALLDKLKDTASDDAAYFEAKAVIRRMEAAASVCSRFLDFDAQDGEIYWLERQRGQRNEPWIRLCITPLFVDAVLREALFEPSRTVICTSATLTVADSFQFWLAKTGLAGLAERGVLAERFPSPFPYRSAVLLACPNDCPAPDEEGYADFVNDAVPRLIQIVGGSALVLFTAYEALRSAYAQAKPILEAVGIKCLKQGDDDRTRLLNAFRADVSSVLFATDSFWEGVDAPGETLRLVLICRLPFRSPGDPVPSARREALAKRGGNPFMELTVPDAVMKFKQGFGRLMRRTSDYGAVVVLDSRVLKKRYGELFIASLPETRRCFGPFAEVSAELERFFYS
jgi:ATP-dependent DNA helicase DinG